MSFAWIPASDSQRSLFFPLYADTFGEALEEDRCGLWSCPQSFYPSFELFKLTLEPQTVHLAAAGGDGADGLKAIPQKSVAFFLMGRTKRHPNEPVLVPLFQNPDWIERLNPILGIKLTMSNVLDYILFFHSDIVYRGFRVVPELSASVFDGREIGIIQGALTGAVSIDRGQIKVNVTRHWYPLVGTIFSVRVPTIQNSRLHYSTIHVSKSGYVLVKSVAAPHFEAKVLALPDRPARYTDMQRFIPPLELRHPRVRFSAVGLLVTFISVTTTVQTLLALQTTQWPALFDISLWPRVEYALFVATSVSLTLIIVIALLYEYRKRLQDRVPYPLMRPWELPDVRFFKFLSGRIGLWPSSAIFMFLQMAAFSFHWAYIAYFVQARWSLISNSPVPPTLDAAYSFAVGSLFVGLFSPVSDILLAFDDVFSAPFKGPELSAWGRATAFAVGASFAFSGARAVRVFINDRRARKTRDA